MFNFDLISCFLLFRASINYNTVYLHQRIVMLSEFKRDNCCFLFMNVFCSVGVIAGNKCIFTHTFFPSVLLTLIHFLVAICGLYVCQARNVFYVKTLPILMVLPSSIAFCVFIVLNNISLQLNTISSYQILKVLSIPCAYILTNRLRGGSPRQIIVLVLVIGGIAGYAYNDSSTDLHGILCAFFGAVTMSVYQWLLGKHQKELQANPLQLLYYHSIVSSIVLVVIVVVALPFLNDTSLILQHWTPSTLISVLLSGCLSFLINLSMFWIPKSVSFITLEVVGHIKFFLTLLLGVAVFNDRLTSAQLVCIVVLTCGLQGYSFFTAKTKLSQRSKTLPYSVR